MEYGRDGQPLVGCIVGRLIRDGHRFLANHADSRTLKELATATIEPIGRKGFVAMAANGRNLFTLEAGVKM